jgi:hypothetical protein
LGAGGAQSFCDPVGLPARQRACPSADADLR